MEYERVGQIWLFSLLSRDMPLRKLQTKLIPILFTYFSDTISQDFLHFHFWNLQKCQFQWKPSANCRILLKWKSSGLCSHSLYKPFKSANFGKHPVWDSVWKLKRLIELGFIWKALSDPDSFRLVGPLSPSNSQLQCSHTCMSIYIYIHIYIYICGG